MDLSLAEITELVAGDVYRECGTLCVVGTEQFLVCGTAAFISVPGTVESCPSFDVPAVFPKTVRAFCACCPSIVVLQLMH